MVSHVFVHYGCDLLIQVACLQLAMACCFNSENKQTHVRAVIVIAGYAIGRKHVCRWHDIEPENAVVGDAYSHVTNKRCSIN